MERVSDTNDLQSLQELIQILRETSEQCEALNGEASQAISMEDAVTWKEKKLEKGRLLVELPNRLSGKLEGIDPELRREVESQTQFFAKTAEEALATGNTFTLGVLLTKQGDSYDDKNALEELIDMIEKPSN